MRYALLINENPTAYEGLDADDRAAITAEYTHPRGPPRGFGRGPTVAGRRPVSNGPVSPVPG